MVVDEAYSYQIGKVYFMWWLRFVLWEMCFQILIVWGTHRGGGIDTHRGLSTRLHEDGSIGKSQVLRAMWNRANQRLTLEYLEGKIYT